MNHALQSNHCYGNSSRLNRRPGQIYGKANHLRSSESWRGLKTNEAADWKKRANCTEKEILPVLSSEEENDSSSQSPKLLTRQLALDVNAETTNNKLDSPPEEKSSSEPLSDPSLDWDQENLALKTGTNLTLDLNGYESYEMKSLTKEPGVSVLDEIAEEVEHDEYDKLLTEKTSFANTSDDVQSIGTDSPPFAKKYSSDFSKHLYLTCDQDDVDKKYTYPLDTLDDISENANNDNLVEIDHEGDLIRKKYDEGDTITKGLCEEPPRLGYTDFDTMNNVPRRSRFSSSPTHSSLHRSPVHDILTSPVESVRGSARDGFSELPFRDGFSDSLSEQDNPCEGPKGIPSGNYSGIARVNRENSTDSSSKVLSQEDNRPRDSRSGTLSESRLTGSPGGSLKNGQHDGRKRNGGLRRTLTEFNCPSDSSGSLNKKVVASTRRRKVSAVIQPPAIFAPLVTNVNNPYKDFVPPVRESAITCDCDLANHMYGMNYGNCADRKSDYLQSDPECNSEDKNDDFFRNVEKLIGENNLQGSNLSGSDYRFEQSEGYSSKLTVTSENWFDNDEQRSDPSQRIDDESIEGASVKGLANVNHFEFSFCPFPNLNQPSISGAYSTHCIEKDEMPESSELGQMARPIRTSFSEPHLSLRLPVLPGSNGSTEKGIILNEREDSLTSEDTTTRNLEEIFKDVCSTKEAIEKLEMILKSPEPELLSDLADTKQTVQKLDKQVSKLNREVVSLSNDVKTVLELLKGLKNGQVQV